MRLPAHFCQEKRLRQAFNFTFLKAYPEKQHLEKELFSAELKHRMKRLEISMFISVTVILYQK